jgi:Spy/CpxP family protein refolding chaperone
LSDEQAAQMRRLRSEERRQAIRRRADLAIARMELEEALDAPSVDEKLVAARVRAVADLQAAEVRARADRRLALRKMLTPEQQGKLKQLMRERRGAPGAGRRGGRSRRPARDAVEDRVEPGR